MNGVRTSSSTNNTPPSQQSKKNSKKFDNDSDMSSSASASSDEAEDDDSYGNTDDLRQNETSRLDGDDSQPQSEEISVGKIFKNITIEPMMLIHMFGYTISSVVVQNLYIDRICRISLKYNETVCDNLALEEFHKQEDQIDQIASKFVTYRSLIEAGFPIIFSLFLGPWTDIHGCKWPMLMPMLGYFLSAMSYVMLSNIPDAPPELLLISSIPVSIVGGLVALIMSAFSFIAKGTTEENRSFRVAMVEASWFLGGPLGILTGGLIYKSGGFTPVFATAACCFLTAFVYGLIVIREEMPEIENRERRSCIADMFNVQAVKDMFGTVFLRRSGLQRRWLLLMLFAISLRIFALFGYIQNLYLYTRNKLGWDLKRYTEYSVSDSFIAISGGYVMIMTMMKIFHVPDAIIGISSSVGPFFAQFIFAFAMRDHSWMMYIGATTQMFSGLISIVLRAMISKVVAKEEIARVYTFLACSEATMPLIAVPLYSYIFRHTLTTFPGTMFMVSAGAYLAIIICFIYLYFSMKNSNNHVQMENPTEIENSP